MHTMGPNPQYIKQQNNSRKREVREREGKRGNIGAKRGSGARCTAHCWTHLWVPKSYSCSSFRSPAPHNRGMSTSRCRSMPWCGSPSLLAPDVTCRVRSSSGLNRGRLTERTVVHVLRPTFCKSRWAARIEMLGSYTVPTANQLRAVVIAVLAAGVGDDRCRIRSSGIVLSSLIIVMLIPVRCSEACHMRAAESCCYAYSW